MTLRGATKEKTATKTRPETSLAPPWNVIVHDDPVTLMSYVTKVFVQVFGYAQDKAQQLTQKFERAGLPVPEDQDIIVRSLGTDGGNVCDNPASALGRAVFNDVIANGADFVGRRPIIIDRAYNKELGFFTQSFDGEHADASNLLLPALGLIDPLDPRFRSTVRAYEKLLAPNGLMLRYKHLDDFGHTTSAFSICSFWWVEALAMMGEVDEAVALFRRLEKHANPLGLFSEDIDPETGALLGNFPQAYTHVGLIHAAITIGEILDARHGSFRAWS